LMVGNNWVCLVFNNFDDGKHLGMFGSQQFWWWKTFGYVYFSTILMVENKWICLFLNAFDGGKILSMNDKICCKLGFAVMHCHSFHRGQGRFAMLPLSGCNWCH
jgi:hypothetical protein